MAFSAALRQADAFDDGYSNVAIASPKKIKASPLYKSQKARAVSAMYREFYSEDLVSLKIEAQSTRAIRKALAAQKVLAQPEVARHTEVSKWVFATVDGILLLSIAVVATAFFVLLSNVSASGIGSIAPSAFAVVAFSIVGMSSHRMRRSLLRKRDGAHQN